MEPPTALREATVKLASGFRLHYAEAGAEHPRTLVLLHGYTDSWRSFELVMPLLAQSHRVLALDCRGHGDSAKPDGDDYSTVRLARDVAEFLDHLQVPATTLIGHSMGSFIARRMAVDFPERVENLVMVATALTGDNCNVRALARAVEAFGDQVPATFIHDFQSSCIAQPRLMPEWFFRQCLAASTKVPPHVWRAVCHGMRQIDQTYRLGTITCPTLVLGGRRDAVFSLAEQEEVVRYVPGAHGRFYRHAGHSPHWEEPGRFAEDVLEFLEGMW
jgi:pimeloyl-ACP methyl ester carboxylesterase